MNIGEAQAAASQILEDIRPTPTRATTVQAIAIAVINSLPLMAWFKHVSELPHHDGKIDSNNVSDVLGEALWQWKEYYGIGEDDPDGVEFAELAHDPQLYTLINRAMVEYDADLDRRRGTTLVEHEGLDPELAQMIHVLDEGVDWDEVEYMYGVLGTMIEHRNEREALDFARKLVGELEP